MNVLSAAERAATMAYRLTGGQAKPERIAEMYRLNAATMREYAVKAAAAKSGKHCGYTAPDCTAKALELDALAVDAPAAYVRLFGDRP